MNIYGFSYLIAALFILSLTNCKIQKSTPQTKTESEYVDAYFDYFETPNPGVSYMVIKDGEIVLQKNAGYADVENKIETTSETNYRIASISKPFTATAILKLISDGKLSYETTLSQIFPGFPEYGDNITVEHLLMHRSGIIEYYGFFKEGEQLSDEDVLEGLMSVNTINALPNEKFEYRNSGYALLAQIVENISGKEFEDYMADEIFNPIGMKNTSLYVKGKNIPNRAYGYTIEEGGYIKKTDQSQGTAVKGDGCIYSSLKDFYFWDQALYTDKIVPQDVLADAFYGYDIEGKTDKSGYGYGWQINYDANNNKIIEHTGSSLGFTHHYLRVPSQNISVVLFTNRFWTFYENIKFTNISYKLLNHFSEGKINAPIKE